LHYVQGSDGLEKPLYHPVVSIGNFDGMHVGHRAIIDTVVERARQLGGEAVVYTFDPHPRKVLQPHRAPPLISTIEQRVELLGQAGVDTVIVEPFTPEFAKTPAEVFIREILYEKIRPVEVYVGYDFHFGRDREGSMRLLTEMGPKLGFSVTIIPEVTVDAGDVNSTRIRRMLFEGRVEEAFAMLGRNYTIRGRVVEGDRRGRDIGFPTANLDPENEALIREATGRLLEGRTAIIIAHRLNTVYQADKIVVLRDGRLLESGSHSDLIQDGDFYPKLVQAYAGATGMTSHWTIHAMSYRLSSVRPGVSARHTAGEAVTCTIVESDLASPWRLSWSCSA